MQAAIGDEAKRIVDRYEVLGEIASGGMATVRFGKLRGAEGFSRTVAIKCLHPQFAHSRDFRVALIDEARLVSRVSHPNVVQTLDVVADDDDLFLILEYVRGESLSALIRASSVRGDRITPAITASIMVGVLRGLHAAHEARNDRGEPLSIVHRDVSPQNILVGADGIARVLDFGVAKAEGRLQITRRGTIKGKIGYMSPEQITGGTVDRRTDVYAVGIVLWEALTERRLFSGELSEPQTRLVEGAIPRPSTRQSDIPPALDAVVLKALAVDPGQRFFSAEKMADEIERAMTPAPASRVAAWVNELADETLRYRDKILSDAVADDTVTDLRAPIDRGPVAVDTGAMPSERSAPSNVGEAAQPKKRSRRMIAAAALVVLAAVVIGGGLLGRMSEAEVAPLAPTPPPQAPQPEAAVTPEPARDPAPDAAPSPEPKREPRAPMHRPPAPHSTPRAKTKTKTDDCDPPFVREPDGTKRYKRECL
jgi:eukaryotic-like serine/threonine-protein kinase